MPYTRNLRNRQIRVPTPKTPENRQSENHGASENSTPIRTGRTLSRTPQNIRCNSTPVQNSTIQVNNRCNSTPIPGQQSEKVQSFIDSLTSKQGTSNEPRVPDSIYRPSSSKTLPENLYPASIAFTPLIKSATVSDQELAEKLEDSIRIQQSTQSDRNTSAIMSTFNKELIELMNNNIQKFELNTESNVAIELRAFIKSCENLFDIIGITNAEDETVKAQKIKDFFKLIKIRLGYNVQERMTEHSFKNLKEFENHLRTVCNIRQNRDKLLHEIRHEYQKADESVSKFAERLRKLIAQGRSEHPDDKEFEKEAAKTLRFKVRNELVSIKLMDCDKKPFEELAEIAIQREISLTQRLKSENNSEMIDNLLRKIKSLESKIQSQEATVQTIRFEANKQSVQTRKPYSTDLCNYCKKPGHFIKDCNKKRYKDLERMKAQSQNQGPITQPKQSNDTTICVRCKKIGHKSNKCYAIICSFCHKIGHQASECRSKQQQVQTIQSENEPNSGNE